MLKSMMRAESTRRLRVYMEFLLSPLQKTFRAYLGLLWVSYQHRFLITRLIIRDIKSRTSGTWLGGLWMLIQPAFQLVGLWFVLGFVIKDQGAGRVPFLDYYFVAMIPWLMINELVTRALHILHELQGLYQRTVFPVVAIPVAMTCSTIGVYALINAGFIALHMGAEFSLRGVLIIIAIGLSILPLVLIVSLLGVFVREAKQIIPLIMSFFMYASPILYQPEALPQKIRVLNAFNPIAGLTAWSEWLINGLVYTEVNYSLPINIFLVALPVSWALFVRLEPYIRELL